MQPSLGKEIARAFVLSLAATAGTWVGIGAVGFTYDQYEKLKAKKKAKASAN